MRVCVIGAGVSGLPSIKACLEQNLEVDCFEKTSSIGGLWNYRPNEDNVGANVMASTVNTSKELMAYSDFPPPPEWPNFMHHSYVQKYLEMYAKHFDLIKYIHFNTEVIEVRRVDGDDQDRFKKWSVSLSNGITKIYSAVLICTGHHCEPRIPGQINGLTTFKGRILHSKHYHDYKGFENKRVMLVGIGNSSLDIAVELAGIAKNVVISTRRGTWLFNRITQRGLPYDVVYQSRFYDWLMRTVPWSIANDFHEWRMQQRTDHNLYGLRPPHRFFQQHPAVNDALTNLLASGRDDINYIDEYNVHTKDGRCYQMDVIILCTGYSFGFPFIKPSGLIPVTEDNQVDLYKLILPPSPSARGLAVIGLVQYLPYMDELAEQIGCSPPNIKKILWKEPSFALRLLFGPNVPYIYRLQGPNTWADARKVIEGVPYRVKTPLKQRFQIIKNKNTKKGLADNLFDYSMTKCLALYFFIIFGVGAWLFGNQTFSFLLHSAAIIIVAFMGYIFYFDISWL
uniref:Flavin-containing monooxygenase n=1 Tax=Meloidogyne floridensis TaxID=298350 RepID=A0A915NF52_9BILA